MDVMFEYQGKVKQDRLNRFVELLDEAFKDKDISLGKLKTEENIDLFETIIRKVVQTRHEHKRIGFKNILIRGLNKNNIDLCEMYADILGDLKAKEFEILLEHKKYLFNGKGALAMQHELDEELYGLQHTLRNDKSVVIPEEILYSREDKVKKDLESVKALVNEYRDKCSAEHLGLNSNEYLFFLQSLYGKGLLFDDGVGAIGVRPFQIMSVTDFGVNFMNYIDEAHLEI